MGTVSKLTHSFHPGDEVTFFSNPSSVLPPNFDPNGPLTVKGIDATYCSQLSRHISDQLDGGVTIEDANGFEASVDPGSLAPVQ